MKSHSRCHPIVANVLMQGGLHTSNRKVNNCRFMHSQPKRVQTHHKLQVCCKSPIVVAFTICFLSQILQLTYNAGFMSYIQPCSIASQLGDPVIVT